MNRTLFAIVVGFALGGSVRPADAGCGHLFHKQAVVHHAAVVQPIVLYGVGSDLAIEAAVERAFLRREQKQPQVQQPGTLQQTAPPQDYASSLLQKSVMVQKCNRCHSGENRLTNADGTLDPATFRRFANMAGLGRDVPNEMKAVIAGLTPEEKGNITEALLMLPPSQPAKPEPQVPPPPEPGILR